MADNTLPPIPEGYTLMQPGQSALPPIPDGYQLMQPGASAPAAPPPGMYGNGALQTMDDVTTGIGEDIPFKNELFAGIAAPFRAGYGYVTGGDSSLGNAYDKELARLHKIETDANARSPVGTTVGNVLGFAMGGPEAVGAKGLAAANAAKADALINGMETPASRFARLWAATRTGGANVAKSGLASGAYGGAMGASNALDENGDMSDVADKALTGAEWGAGAGMAMVPAGSVIGAIGDNVIAPAARTLYNTGKQASINLASYLGRDAASMAGKEIPARGLTDAEAQGAQDAGYPVLNIHKGADTVASAARAAADASPEARNIIEPQLNAIQQGQMDRYGSLIDSYLPEGGAQAARDAALTEGRNQAAPLYDAAYANPNAQDMYHEGYEQLMQSPIFQSAMKGALKTSQDEAALSGANVVLPKFVYKDMGDGTKRLTWAPEQGNPTPSLPFWNEVKKNLDDIIGNNTEINGKANNTARLATKLKTQLLNMTDDMVPEYAAARQAAGRYLGESNAFDAGTKLYSQANGAKLNVDDAQKMINAWTPAERDAAGSAYLDALKNDLLSKARANNSGSADLSLNFMKSQKAQQVGNMLLGPDVMNQLEMHNSIERLMASRRTTVMGNSKTNRYQLSRDLLAPAVLGVGEGAMEGGDNMFDLTHLGHMGSTALTVYALRHGARGLNTHLQTRLAPELASRLMANDSSAYVPALHALASDPTTMGWMRLLSRMGTGAAAQHGAQ